MVVWCQYGMVPVWYGTMVPYCSRPLRLLIVLFVSNVSTCTVKPLTIAKTTNNSCPQHELTLHEVLHDHSPYPFSPYDPPWQSTIALPNLY